LSSAAITPFRLPTDPAPGARAANGDVLAPPTQEEMRRINRARRRATRLDEQKRAFLRMVSHELRTPLNAIIGFSEIIACELYGPLGAPQYKEYAEHVRSSGHKLLRLVNQVLEMARLEGHALDLNLQAEPLDIVIEDVLVTLRDELAARGARVDVLHLDQPGAPMPLVMADPRGLRNLLVNLLQNAITHGAAPVSVHVRRAADGVQPFVADAVRPPMPENVNAKLTVQMPARPRRPRTPTIVVRTRGPTKQQKLVVFVAMLLVFVGGGIAFLVYGKHIGLDLGVHAPTAPARTTGMTIATAVPPPAPSPTIPAAAPTPVVAATVITSVAPSAAAPQPSVPQPSGKKSTRAR